MKNLVLKSVFVLLIVGIFGIDSALANSVPDIGAIADHFTSVGSSPITTGSILSAYLLYLTTE
jgi:hypothetical protein